MAHITETRMSGSSEGRRGSGWSAFGWLMGILGGISAFLGLFVMYGPEEEYIGLGGDLSWMVGEVSTTWMYGLLIGGFVALAAGLAMIIIGGRRAERAGGQTSEMSELVWHSGVFLLVNGFIWAQDLAIGGGVDYAYWVTIPWAVGLGVHATLYYWSSRRHAAVAGRHRGDLQPH